METKSLGNKEKETRVGEASRGEFVGARWEGEGEEKKKQSGNKNCAEPNGVPPRSDDYERRRRSQRQQRGPVETDRETQNKERTRSKRTIIIMITMLK
jgi:hypothetical protein